MPLDDNNSNNSGASLRLSKLNHRPDKHDLDVVLAQAKKNTSALIELPFKSQSSPTFVLKVSSFSGDEDTNWMLYQGETADAAVLWSFDSDDTTLIESLIAAECGSDRKVTASNTNSSLVVSNFDATEPRPVPRMASSLVANVDLPAPVEWDQDELSELDKHLTNPETGLFTSTAFFYFLGREYARYESLTGPMAVIVFELLANYGGDKVMPMPERALKEAVKRFRTIMRSVDTIAHYKQRQFAFLLPGMTSNDAVQFGKRIEKVLLDGPLQPGLDSNQAILLAGVASIPDTCDHPGIVLAACEKALGQAKERKTSLALFPSLANR